MVLKIVLFLLFVVLSICNAYSVGSEGNEIEGRGKKKKIALFVYFADLIVKKIFILKLIYAFVFWVVLHKAGYFLGWFASYLKEKKHEFHHDHPPHHHYDHPPSHSYGPPGYDSYGPYRRHTQGL